MATYAVPRRYQGAQSETESPCPNAAEHTPCPAGYLAWWSWAERMNRTHGQRQCTGCGRWAVWVKRPDGAPAICWGCGEAKVDPARFGIVGLCAALAFAGLAVTAVTHLIVGGSW